MKECPECLLGDGPYEYLQMQNDKVQPKKLFQFLAYFHSVQSHIDVMKIFLGNCSVEITQKHRDI